jgi:glycosyltransferase involved in cell wall biosynthesis
LDSEAGLKVAHLPPGYDSDRASYIGLLRDAMRADGVEVVTDLTLAQCLRNDAGLEVVHLHWLEYIVTLDPTPRSGFIRSAVRAGRFLRDLARLRRRGISVVWTVHNLRPHEPRQPIIEHALAATTMLLSHGVITHSAYARERLSRVYPATGKISVIPHGNYTDAFAHYGVADPHSSSGAPFEFLCFGQIRPYKQLPELVRAFRALPTDAVRLVIAGKPVVEAELERIREAAGDDGRVVIDARHIPDDEVSALHRRADAAIFAYRDVFSSGALLLALSYGLPVVAPAVSTATELVSPPGVETFGPGELTAALDRMRTGDWRARRDAALQAAETYPWSAVAASTVALYQRLRTRSRRGHRT